MRRLPVYLLLDTSGSMYGEPIEAVKNGVQTLISTLRSDPYALETAYISIITFNSSAQQVTPLTELAAFQQPNIDASGCTALGGALELLSQKIDSEITKTTAEVKGDWRPLIFIMTDGVPTDDISRGLAEFKKRKCGMVVACAAGQGAKVGAKLVSKCTPTKLLMFCSIVLNTIAVPRLSLRFTSASISARLSAVSVASDFILL